MATDAAQWERSIRELTTIASAAGQLAAVAEVVVALNRQMAFVHETVPQLEPEIAAALDDLGRFSSRCRAMLEVLGAKIDVDVRISDEGRDPA